MTFDGLGEHAFEDDRIAAKGDHPLDRTIRASTGAVDPAGRRQLRLRLVARARAAVPHALRLPRLHRPASFADIFFGNCTALGLPCATLEPSDLEALMESVSLDPGQTVTLDLQARTVRSKAGVMQAGVRDGTRQALLEGSWNATAVLLEAGDAIEQAAGRIPYVGGFAG